MMRSPCCDAAVRVESEYPSLMGGEMTSNWYACTACGKACDPVSHDAECESEFDSQVHAQTPCGCESRRAK